MCIKYRGTYCNTDPGKATPFHWIIAGCVALEIQKQEKGRK
jgi:hypothetical protein